MYPVLRVQKVVVVTPSAKEAHLNMRSADAERFLAIHCVPDGSACIFLGPHSGQSSRILQAHINGVSQHDPSQAPLNGSVRLSVSTIEIILAVRAAGVVRVGATRHAELVRVVAARVLHCDAIFQGLPGEAAVNVVNAANIWWKTE